MHANRNKKAVKRVEKGMMKANRIRNLFAVFAIVLTTFMITTVFSLGINYMENMKLMQVRTAGTTANAWSLYRLQSWAGTCGDPSCLLPSHCERCTGEIYPVCKRGI